MCEDNILPVKRVKELLSYDPNTGEFTRKVQIGKGRKPGPIKSKRAGNNYLDIWIEGRSIRGHRLAVAISTGTWPTTHVDHVNGDRTDNRLSNLRVATNAENMRNRPKTVSNTSGRKGVSWHKKAGKWSAGITVDGRKIHLGLFTDIDAASSAYAEASRRYFGDFSHISFVSEYV